MYWDVSSAFDGIIDNIFFMVMPTFKMDLMEKRRNKKNPAKNPKNGLCFCECKIRGITFCLNLL